MIYIAVVLVWLLLAIVLFIGLGMDGVFEVFIALFMSGVGVVAAFVFICFAVFAYDDYALERDHPCIRAHNATVHVEASTLYVMVGKVLIPVTTPAHDEVRTICDERRP